MTTVIKQKAIMVAKSHENNNGQLMLRLVWACVLSSVKMWFAKMMVPAIAGSTMRRSGLSLVGNWVTVSTNRKPINIEALVAMKQSNMNKML